MRTAINRYKTYLRVCYWRLEQLLEVLIAFLILVASLPPLRNRLSVEDEDVEECVEEKDDVGFDRYTIKQYGLRRYVEGVGHKCGLNHDQGVINVLFVKYVSRNQQNHRIGKKLSKNKI